MKICGLKLTHDGGMALLDDDRLVFSLEMEKIDNNRRYRPLGDVSQVPQLLGRFGYAMADIDLFVIDGWDGRLTSTLTVDDGAKRLKIQAAPYFEPGRGRLFETVHGAGLEIEGRAIAFESYPHLAGHLAAAWLTSPFARSEETADCLIWDGSIFPRLYRIDPAARTVTWRGHLFNLIGHVYAMAGEYFGPYRRERKYNRIHDLGTAGKLMAYIALGRPLPQAVDVFGALYTRFFEPGPGAAEEYLSLAETEGGSSEPAMAHVHAYLAACQAALGAHADADILASFHVFLEKMLVQGLGRTFTDGLPPSRNLCLVGGCALNIKWNSAIRASGRYEAVWAPPFPNDSGSAIGAACSARMARSKYSAIDWNVYSGPRLDGASEPPPGWRAQACSLSELASLLAAGEPVVFLSGQAELGPRALGARSMLAAATSSAMKDLLNEVKQREPFRPVAPLCLEDRAPEIFDPGSPDPFMLFEHQTRAEWKDRIPAVIHLDGTARLQTVSRDAGTPIAQLLAAYEALTGIPLLCNTSANYSGKGFFPDAASACQWGLIANVWADGELYTRESRQGS